MFIWRKKAGQEHRSAERVASSALDFVVETGTWLGIVAHGVCDRTSQFCAAMVESGSMSAIAQDASDERAHPCEAFVAGPVGQPLLAGQRLHAGTVPVGE